MALELFPLPPDEIFGHSNKQNSLTLSKKKKLFTELEKKNSRKNPKSSK
jgi:hypothetical protein